MTQLTLDEACSKREELRESGQRVVFTNGCFDLLHPGHVHILEEAARQGDYLIVAVNSDDSVRRLKGAVRPIQGESDRVRVLNALEPVDDTIIFDEDTPLRVIEALPPDVLVKGADYEVDEIVGAEHVQSSGGDVHRVELLSGYGTSDIIRRIRNST
jgi:D-beta-D-heptose 7-phosphate kinase/D-beta-D-heptose 1-phosphate adenosyltransferase